MKDERLITFVYEFSESILCRLLSFIFERSGPLSNQESEVIHVLQSNARAACHVQVRRRPVVLGMPRAGVQTAVGARRGATARYENMYGATL